MAYDAEEDGYTCTQGKHLKLTEANTKLGVLMAEFRGQWQTVLQSLLFHADTSLHGRVCAFATGMCILFAGIIRAYPEITDEREEVYARQE